MATISPVTLEITRIPNTDLARIRISYSITGSNQDIATGQSYSEICQLIGDDTPGDGTDDILGAPLSGTITFSGTSTGFQRGFSLSVPLRLLDEDSGGVIPQSDEIRALVTITPILPAPASRESNQVTLSASVIG